MSFKDLTEPTLFLASPGDVEQFRVALLPTIKRFTNKRLNPYAWEAEVSKSGFDQWRLIQTQIPLPSNPLCKVVLCLFAERIGTAMENAESYAKYLGPKERLAFGDNRLELHWQPGMEMTGAFPLTGTVFEVLVALAANEEQESTRGRPSLAIWFVGDKTILEAIHSDLDVKRANWGNRTLFNCPKTLEPGQFSGWENDYLSQIIQLRNFARYLKRRGVAIDESKLLRNPADAVGKCKDLLSHFGYRDPARHPFKGLKHYDFADRNVLCGRKDWIESALQSFRQSWDTVPGPFYGVVGASGAGKSSLLRAGMLPLLQEEGYEVTICEPTDFSSLNENTRTSEFADTPLGMVVRKALRSICETPIFDEETEDVVTVVTDPDKERIRRIVDQLGDTSSQVEWAIEKIREELNTRSSSPNRLVIGLDQFEELLDYRTIKDSSGNAQLDLFFEFIIAACASGQIGFIYTCQNNRLNNLEAEPLLAPIIRRKNQSKVQIGSEDELRRMIHEMFTEVNFDLDVDILVKLCDQIENLEQEIRNSEASSLKPDEIRTTLLPLLSLSLLHLYQYCEEKRDEFRKPKPLKKDFGKATSEEVNPPGDRPDEDDETIRVEVGQIPGKVLEIKNAITVLADKALARASQWPGVIWTNDELDSLLLRLVRVKEDSPGHYNLPSISIPTKGVQKALVESFIEHRLLIPVGRNEVRLVHEAVIQYWPVAEKRVTEKERLMNADQKDFRRRIDNWESAGRSATALQPVDQTVIDLAGEFLSNWWSLFKPDDGTIPSADYDQLCDFSLAVLEAAMTPNATIKTDTTTTHFLTAVKYGRTDLIQRYLEIEPDAAMLHRTSRQANAAYQAVWTRDLATLKLVVEKGASPTAVNNENRQPIHVAAFIGSSEMVDFLVENGADPSARGDLNETPLHLAAANGQKEMVQHFLDVYKADPAAEDANLVTALHLACQYGSLGTVKLLLDQPSVSVSAKQNEGWTPLHLACRFRDAEMVRLLMQHKTADPTLTVNGWTPLQLTVFNNLPVNKSDHIVQVLLKDERVDRTAKTPDDGKNLVQLTIDENRVDVLEALFADPFKKVDPDGGEGNTDTPLFKACAQGKTDFVRVLVAGGADVSSALLAACERGDDGIVNLLLPKADRSLTNARGQTGLHLAALNGHTKVVSLMLDFYDPEILDQSGKAALHLAVEAGLVNVVELMLSGHPELRQHPDRVGRSFPHLAAAKGHAQFLEPEFGFDVEAPDAHGLRPLHYAARYGQLQFTEQLLKTNAVDVDAQDDCGWTPLHFAAQNGHIEIVKLLLRHGADKSLRGFAPALSPWLAAVAAGQTDLVEVLKPADKKRAERRELWEEAMYLAVKNAQFETGLAVAELANQ